MEYRWGMLGKPYNGDRDVALTFDNYVNEHHLYLRKHNEVIKIEFANIVTYIKRGLHYRFNLYDDNEEFTFRDYGKLKDFTWKRVAIESDHALTYPVIKKTYLERLRSSPKIPIEKVTEIMDEGRVYGLHMTLERDGNVTSGRLSIDPIHKNDISINIYRDGVYENLTDIQQVLDMLGESDVIGIHVLTGDEIDLLIMVNDYKVKEYIDKLVTIYDKLRDYLTHNNTPLGTVINNIDLYHCLSYGV